MVLCILWWYFLHICIILYAAILATSWCWYHHRPYHAGDATNGSHTNCGSNSLLEFLLAEDKGALCIFWLWSSVAVKKRKFGMVSLIVHHYCGWKLSVVIQITVIWVIIVAASDLVPTWHQVISCHNDDLIIDNPSVVLSRRLGHG